MNKRIHPGSAGSMRRCIFSTSCDQVARRELILLCVLLSGDIFAFSPFFLDRNSLATSVAAVCLRQRPEIMILAKKRYPIDRRATIPYQMLEQLW
jgi:hypothetical protein